jgi:hypothetical protein
VEGKPARLAKPPAKRRGAPAVRKGEVLHDAITRARVCAARAAEDARDFARAAAAWRALGDLEQGLRCRVAQLEADGQHGEAAALLESKQRHATAAAAWRRAGDDERATRCDARVHEKKGRLLEAAEAWASVGETAESARCRATAFFRAGEYEAAVREAEHAGATEILLHSRLLAAKLRGDYQATVRLMTEAGLGKRLQAREAWMVEAREFAAFHARHMKRPGQAAASDGAAGDASAPVQAPPLPAPDPPPAAVPAAGGEEAVARTGPRQPAPGAGRRRAPRAAPVGPSDLTWPEGTVDSVFEAVRAQPGLTRENLAQHLRLPTDVVQRVLAVLMGEGAVVKTGRTRGTRYHPA